MGVRFTHDQDPAPDRYERSLASPHQRARRVTWRGVLYTAEATVTGGRAAGHGTQDGKLEVDLRLPEEMGGDGGGTNPEQLFAVGFASCFESAIGVIGRRQKAEVDDSRSTAG